MVDELKLSTKYQLANPELEENFKKLVSEREYKKSIEVAKKMLKLGVPLETVLEGTGVTKEDIT